MITVTSRVIDELPTSNGQETGLIDCSCGKTFEISANKNADGNYACPRCHDVYRLDHRTRPAIILRVNKKGV